MNNINRYNKFLKKKPFGLFDVKQQQRMMILGDLGEAEKKPRPSFGLLDAKQKQRLEILGTLD